LVGKPATVQFVCAPTGDIALDVQVDQ
jgi:hypothetical protein